MKLSKIFNYLWFSKDRDKNVIGLKFKFQIGGKYAINYYESALEKLKYSNTVLYSFSGLGDAEKPTLTFSFLNYQTAETLKKCGWVENELCIWEADVKSSKIFSVWKLLDSKL